MAQTVRSAKMDSRNARKKLAVRPNTPYYVSLEHGRAVGYRKSRAGGSWVARLYLGERQYAYEHLGAAAIPDTGQKTIEVQDASTGEIFSFDVWMLRECELSPEVKRQALARGVAVVVLEDVRDDWTRQAVINEARRQAEAKNGE